MAFSRSLSTKEMAKYVVRHFEWDRHGMAFPPSPLPKDFQALCPSYELVVEEEAAEDYELPDLSQVIFYAMLLNEAERLGVLHGRALRTLESAFTELRWTRFQTKAELEGSSGAGQQEEGSEVEPAGESSATEGRPPLLTMISNGIHPSGRSSITGEEGKQRMLGMSISPFIIAFPPLYDTMEMAAYVREGDLHVRLIPSPKITTFLRFSLPEAEGAATDFELPEMVQVTFYAMILDEAVELGVVCGFMAEGLKSALVGQRWSRFEAWMSCVDHELRKAQLWQRAVIAEVCGPLNGQEESSGSNGPPPPSSDKDTEQAAEYIRDHFRWSLRDRSALGLRPLPSDYHGLCPRFDLKVATQYTHDSNTLEVVQIGFMPWLYMIPLSWAFHADLPWTAALWKHSSGTITKGSEEPRPLILPFSRQTPGGGQPLLVREGNIKPSSEITPFAFHGLLSRVRPYCGNVVCTYYLYP
ncbi:LOW QUALITY PROTEIN: hypothetical protein Cgig2_011321 [Carnegiea gigantea]|uniref:Uncharacterized protein n=1 Tax=Carnegiea gigantea TaxID=171969 RepID=A0A9Q1KFZ0_9CARY|nr:LOW QUALITY PROTEIN: hypothetical protein Cgig2_011321 [Carnegiea gigantea]